MEAKSLEALGLGLNQSMDDDSNNVQQSEIHTETMAESQSKCYHQAHKGVRFVCAGGAEHSDLRQATGQISRARRNAKDLNARHSQNVQCI